MNSIHTVVAVAATLTVAPPAHAQTTQRVAPPQSQAWIDVATFSGFGAPMGAGGSPGIGMVGGLLGGGGAKNTFGHTQTGSPGRWVDVTLMTRNNPQLSDAQQGVPQGFGLAPVLKLQAPPRGDPVDPGDDTVVEPKDERPRGKLILYWGCGETVRSGQPRVLDVATAKPEDLARFFTSRRATQRGTHSAAGRPVWPSPPDARMVPDKASLVGEHAFSGSGVPEGFRFNLPAAQDLMPAIDLRQRDAGGATQLDWTALPTARAYFIAAMGGKGGGDAEMTLWTSSELPDIGFGLLDYQTNAAVDRWLGEKVLLAPSRTSCTIPKGIFTGEGAMVRMIAYGNELNLAHPPRPSDPKVAWEPVWAAKVRVKSMTMAMLGMPTMGETPTRGAAEPEKPTEEQAADKKQPKPLDVIRGILGR